MQKGECLYESGVNNSSPLILATFSKQSSILYSGIATFPYICGTLTSAYKRNNFTSKPALKRAIFSL